MNIEAKDSAERTEDLVFENLIRRWTEDRQWEWVKGAQIMYGHVLEERERNAPPTGTPENPAIGVVVDDEPDEQRIRCGTTTSDDEPVSVPEQEEE